MLEHILFHLGYIDSDLFIQWLTKAFVPNIGAERPVLLLVDNHSSHLGPDVIKVAEDNGIVLFGFPSHATSRLQPLDVNYFSFMKSEFKKICVEAQMCEDNIVTKREDVPLILKRVLDMEKFQGHAQVAFRKCGIVPFDPESVISEAEKQARKK